MGKSTTSHDLPPTKYFLITSIPFYSLCVHTDIRERLSKAGSLEDMKVINDDLKKLAQVCG